MPSAPRTTVNASSPCSGMPVTRRRRSRNDGLVDDGDDSTDDIHIADRRGDHGVVRSAKSPSVTTVSPDPAAPPSSELLRRHDRRVTCAPEARCSSRWRRNPAGTGPPNDTPTGAYVSASHAARSRSAATASGPGRRRRIAITRLCQPRPTASDPAQQYRHWWVATPDSGGNCPPGPAAPSDNG